MIALENIIFQYPSSSFELNIEAISIKKGSKTAIIGPSGFGKTTLLNLLSGITTPQKGVITINSTKINELSDDERRDYRIQNIGFVFQDFRLIPYLNVLDNILLPFRINPVLTLNAEVTARAKSLANEIGIGDKLKKYPTKLSQGERQRVAICRALINEAPIIFADEPTGNLDPENKRKTLDLLFDYVEKINATLVVVTHDHQMLEGFEETINFANFKWPER